MHRISILILIPFLIFVSVSTLFSQDNTQVGLPEGAIARLGKGGISIIRFSPNGTHLAVGTTVGVWLYDVKTGNAKALFPAKPRGWITNCSDQLPQKNGLRRQSLM